MSKKDKAFLNLIKKIFLVKDEFLRAEILLELQKFINTTLNE